MRYSLNDAPARGRRKIVSYTHKMAEKIFELYTTTKYRIKRNHSENRATGKKINRDSRKIIFVDHSFHVRTKSTAFMIDFLRHYFDVEVVWDDAWQGKPSADLSFVDGSYLAVIFCQSLLRHEAIKKINNDNIIHFPMYDNAVGLGLGYWHRYRDIKIINFSRTLDRKHKKWGFDSLYLQYFPDVKEFVPGDPKAIFFWQRISQININTLSKLFAANDFEIHLHKVIDPGHEYTQPDKADETQYHVKYSDWFKTKAEMLDVIRQKGIYVASREFEGIGMSFLEAMAMGKAVVAVDNPTMNEYITNGENGYLYDLNNIKKIDLSHIGQVQKNCYEFMKNGFKKWEEDKYKIIDFIKK